MFDHRALLRLLAAPAAALGAALALLNLATLAAAQSPSTAASLHPRHEVTTWSARYKGRTFHVARLPRCEHLETLISHEPGGETRARAKQRLGGIASLTGSFHDPRTFWLADFLQRNGSIESGASTGRWLLVMRPDGTLDITGDYASYKGKAGFSAIALGQRLVPLRRDGFSVAFMNRITERMAIGLTSQHVYLVEAVTDIWRLAAFMQNQLHVTIAINSDGGHVVYGRAPVHVVFRWRHEPRMMAPAPVAAPQVSAGDRPAALVPSLTASPIRFQPSGGLDSSLSLRLPSAQGGGPGTLEQGAAVDAILPSRRLGLTPDTRGRG